MEQDKSLDFKMKVKKLIQDDIDRKPSSITLPTKVIAGKRVDAKLDDVPADKDHDVNFSDIDGEKVTETNGEKPYRELTLEEKRRENDKLAEELVKIESERVRIENAIDMRKKIDRIK